MNALACGQGTATAATTAGCECVWVRQKWERDETAPAGALLFPAASLCVHAPPCPASATPHHRRRRRPPPASNPPKPPPAAASHAFATGPPPCHALSAARLGGGAPLATNSGRRPQCVARRRRQRTRRRRQRRAAPSALAPPPHGWPRRRRLGCQRDTGGFSFLQDAGRRGPLLSVAAAVRRPFLWTSSQGGILVMTRDGRHAPFHSEDACAPRIQVASVMSAHATKKLC